MSRTTPTDRTYREEAWDSSEVPGPRPILPDPAGGNLVWVHEPGDKSEKGRRLWLPGWRWADGDDGWTRLTDGLLVYRQLPPDSCDWPPRGWPARVFPLGRSAAHVERWGQHVRGLMDTSTGDLRPDDPEYGWRTILRATRLFAVEVEAVPDGRLGHLLPATREEARQEVEALLDAMQRRMGKTSESSQDTDPNPQYVTLNQMAAIVSKSKKTLERALNDSDSNMPKPDVEGGGGLSHEWLWSRIRPWLESTYRRHLPARFPRL